MGQQPLTGIDFSSVTLPYYSMSRHAQLHDEPCSVPRTPRPSGLEQYGHAVDYFRTQGSTPEYNRPWQRIHPGALAPGDLGPRWTPTYGERILRVYCSWGQN